MLSINEFTGILEFALMALAIACGAMSAKSFLDFEELGTVANKWLGVFFAFIATVTTGVVLAVFLNAAGV